MPLKEQQQCAEELTSATAACHGPVHTASCDRGTAPSLRVPPRSSRQHPDKTLIAARHDRRGSRHPAALHEPPEAPLWPGRLRSRAGLSRRGAAQRQESVPTAAWKKRRTIPRQAHTRQHSLSGHVSQQASAHAVICLTGPRLANARAGENGAVGRTRLSEQAQHADCLDSPCPHLPPTPNFW